MIRWCPGVVSVLFSGPNTSMIDALMMDALRVDALASPAAVGRGT